ncbi:MAG: hypothetical protein IMZ50_10815, partial [Candidatus Atribacteria bacterium]|nr:hypothetical protein [Candidatus Atribacteria bacterium]
IFNAIRVLVPNLVMHNPNIDVTSDYVAYKDYAELLGLATNKTCDKVGLYKELRRWIVDALFTIGIMKVGLAASDEVVEFGDDNTQVDTGQPFAQTVDFDDWVIDPECRRIEEALYQGNRIRVPRLALLESGLYLNNLIEALPSIGETRQQGAAEMSRQQLGYGETTLQDFVELVELWFPGDNTVRTIPAGEESSEEYLREADFYGPKRGPFFYLTFTPPVPNNPMPIAPVGIWYDLHVLANQMAQKICDQAIRQKDVLGYQRAAADDAQNILDANDGDAIAMDSPDGAKMFSFGGQQRSNEAHISQLQAWFNYMSGNTDSLAGISQTSASGTATEAKQMQMNASVGIVDMQEVFYAETAGVVRTLAWYLHTDPLIQLPLTKRVEQAGPPILAPTGIVLPGPKVVQDVQVWLTPEARQGDFLDYVFKITPRSMARPDPREQQMIAENFAVRVIPAAAQAAQTCAMMGVPFSFPRFVIRVAKQLGIDWLEEVFQDPELIAKMQMQLAMGPNPAASKGQPASPGMQNGGGAVVAGGTPPPAVQDRQQAQEGANPSQSALKEGV